MHPSRMHTTHSLPYVRGPLSGGVSWTETPWTEIPFTETPWTETLLDRDPPGQRSPGQRFSWTETPLDREPPGHSPRTEKPTETHLCKHNLRKLRLRAVTTKFIHREFGKSDATMTEVLRSSGNCSKCIDSVAIFTEEFLNSILEWSILNTVYEGVHNCITKCAIYCN